VRRYTLHGKIQSVDLPNKTANIYNEKIEGWMDAMTMEYTLPDGAKLRAGDPITATIVVTDTNYRLENIKSP
jgi:Cu/Ag efflux protein CusF